MAPTQPPVWLDNFAPHGYRSVTGEVFGNRQEPSGAWNTYAASYDDPTQIRSLTKGNEVYGLEDTHRGVSDVSPDGRFMLVHAENPDCWPWWGGPHSNEAQPGKGAYCDVWLARTDGEQAWPLTDIRADGAIGTFWARFDWQDNSRIVYSEIRNIAWRPEIFGGEQLVVADIAWSDDQPHLINRTVIGTGEQYYEPYGFDPTGTKVIAASNEMMPGQPLKAQITLFELDGTSTRLTSALGDDYQEFAFLRPDRTGYVIGSDYHGWFLGTDRWLVTVADPEAEPTRVTHFANWRTGNPQSGFSGGMAFIDNHTAVVGFTTWVGEDAYVIDIP